MKKENPFTVSFGREPINCIRRSDDSEEMICSAFTAAVPSQQVFMITGVRGSGKTVLLSKVKKYFDQEENWTTIGLNPEKDLLSELTAKLYDVPNLKKSFIDAKLNLSLFGISVDFENVPPVQSISTALAEMMKIIQKKNKRLLIAVDEVTDTKAMREFAGEFQILMREEYPVFLIMTGLFKNIYDLQNEKTLTFLYRAPRIYLENLSETAIISSYKKIFGISTDQAQRMAKEVNGYAFAYQLYGFLSYEHPELIGTEELLQEYGEQLGEMVYEQIWKELSLKDKQILELLAGIHEDEIKTEDLIRLYRETYPSEKMTDKLMSVYRLRLKRAGVISTNRFGYLKISLPRLAEYINEYGTII